MKFSIMRYEIAINNNDISFYRIYGSFDSLAWENRNISSHSILSVSHNSRAGKEIEPDFIFVSVLSFEKGVDLLPNLHPCILPCIFKATLQNIRRFRGKVVPYIPKFSSRIPNCSTRII